MAQVGNGNGEKRWDSVYVLKMKCFQLLGWGICPKRYGPQQLKSLGVK